LNPKRKDTSTMKGKKVRRRGPIRTQQKGSCTPSAGGKKKRERYVRTTSGCLSNCPSRFIFFIEGHCPVIRKKERERIHSSGEKKKKRRKKKKKMGKIRRTAVRKTLKERTNKNDQSFPRRGPVISHRGRRFQLTGNEKTKKETGKKVSQTQTRRDANQTSREGKKKDFERRGDNKTTNKSYLTVPGDTTLHRGRYSHRYSGKRGKARLRTSHSSGG